jgi:integrase
MKVTVDKCNTSIRLRFRHEGKPYQRYVGKVSNANDWASAELLAKQIETDHLLGRFDETLEKYFPSKKSHSRTDELLTRLESRLSENYNDVEASLIALVKLFGQINSKTSAKRFITWLLEERKIKESSCSRYVASLRVVAPDFFGDIKIKVPASKPADPFTPDEVKAILNSFKENAPHYRDYVFLLLNTGLRTSECIGVRWKDLDLQKAELHIYETLKRNRGNSAKRMRSTTKTNKYRIVPLNGSTVEMLTNRKATTKSTLVFTSSTGKDIDDHAFCSRYWRKCLQLANVSYRRPYNCRHTFVSTMLKLGQNPIEVAKITGHDPRVMFDKYANVIAPVKTPELW